jgi:hypothetical protein
MWIRPVFADDFQADFRVLFDDVCDCANQIGKMPSIENRSDKEDERFAGRVSVRRLPSSNRQANAKWNDANSRGRHAQAGHDFSPGVVRESQHDASLARGLPGKPDPAYALWSSEPLRVGGKRDVMHREDDRR